MRSADVQDDFLEFGRFGEKRASITVLAKIGLLFIGGGCTCLIGLVFLNIDSDPISTAPVSVAITGSILCVCLGIALCLCSFVVNRTRY